MTVYHSVRTDFNVIVHFNVIVIQSEFYDQGNCGHI
jgi:hypothetical protein